MRKALLLALALTTAAAQKPAEKPPTIAVKTTGMTAMPGLLPLFWDPVAGKLYLEVPSLITTISTPTPSPTAPAQTTSASTAARPPRAL